MTLPDVLAPGLKVLLVGINPGLVSAQVGAQFGNPRNCFWRALHASALTPVLLQPVEQARLLEFGLGITNSVQRVTRGSGDLRAADFEGARERLETLATTLSPAWLAFVGKDAFAPLWRPRRSVALGEQDVRMGGARVFVLPSTSPANAVMDEAEKTRWFTRLATLVEEEAQRPRPARKA